MYETFTSARIQFPTTTKICGKNIHKRAWLTIWSLFQLEILQSCSFVSVFLLVVNVTCNCNSNTYHHQHYFSLNFCKQDKRERRKKLFFLVPQNEDKKVVQVRILLLISLLVLQFQPTSSSLGIQKIQYYFTGLTTLYTKYVCTNERESMVLKRIFFRLMMLLMKKLGKVKDEECERNKKSRYIVYMRVE